MPNVQRSSLVANAGRYTVGHYTTYLVYLRAPYFFKRDTLV